MLFKRTQMIIPAVLLGVIAMIYNGVAPLIWMQNLIIAILCCAGTYFFNHKKWNINYYMIILLSIALLILTLFMGGVDGVHRWVSLIVLRINVSMVVLPILLMAVYHILQAEKIWHALAAVISCAVILFIQPDASQLTGFAAPVILFLFSRKTKWYVKYLTSFLLICLAALSWLFLDSLEPVSYVEGVLTLLNEISPFMMISGIISLLLIPLPFFITNSMEENKIPAIGVGLYYSIILISTIFGNFPVPVMGYGISPLIGYWAACMCLK